jgi:hypothetical protein
MNREKQIRNVADFLVDAIAARGGSVRYSHFYNQGQGLLDELGLGAPWFSFFYLDMTIKLLEEAGVVTTEATSEPCDDTYYDYTITLVGEPRKPWLDLEGKALDPCYVGMPKGAELIDGPARR